MKSELILASTSPYRRELLARLGVPFQCESPGVDEDAAKRAISDPVVLAEHLASAKAQAVAERFPDAVVIGSDQLAAVDGEVLGKPGTAERSVEQLERLAGRTHELVTAVCVLRKRDGRTATHTDRTLLTMRNLAREEFERYVAADRPLDCAGSYKIEAAGIALFSRIETEDFTAITGLPLMAVVRMMREFGVVIP